MNTVSTTLVTDSMETVCVMVNIVRSYIYLVFSIIQNYIKLRDLFFYTGSLRNVETTDVPSSTFWIVAFSISLVINIILTSATFISRRYVIKKNVLLQFLKTHTIDVKIFDFLIKKIIS